VEKKKINISEDAMTLGDLELFEDITGKSFSESLKKVRDIDPATGLQKIDPDPAAKGAGMWTYEMSMKGLAAIIYVHLRKEDPNVTLEEVKSMRLSDFEMTGGEENPTQESLKAESSDPQE